MCGKRFGEQIGGTGYGRDLSELDRSFRLFVMHMVLHIDVLGLLLRGSRGDQFYSSLIATSNWCRRF